jgi:uncharacterized protein YdeI (YjbR/CyaY-like superfamily)
MARKDPRIDAYIAKAAPFAQPILKHLRKIVYAGCPEVEETMKWSMPHFDYKGPFCAMAAFKQHCSFGFWKSTLIFGEEKDDERDGMGHFGRITSLKDLPNEKKLLGYVRKAMALNDAGTKEAWRMQPRKKASPLVVPDYLTAALRKNRRALTTFENFPPSKRREYVEWVSEAKREETRAGRLTTAVKWMAEGKARHWKYQPQ